MSAPQTEEEFQAAYDAALAAGPAANWPFGSGTADDPYYLPDGFAVGDDPAAFLTANPDWRKPQ